MEAEIKTTLEEEAVETVAEETVAVAADAETPVEEPVADAAPEAETDEPAAEAAPETQEAAAEPVAEAAPTESMADMGEALEKSYKNMGDGQHDTDALIAWEKITEMFEAKTEFEVEITGIVKKGVIAVVEGIRGFIPASRLSLGRVDDLNDWLGKTVKVIIITADKDSDKLVLSCREILRRQRDDAKQLKISSIETGAVFDGKVESIQDYGVFVDLGDGVSGLVHVSQISTERVKHPSDVLKVGDEVKVKVIGKKDGKLKLSIKALLEQKKKAEETRVQMPKAENIGTSMGDLLKNLKL